MRGEGQIAELAAIAEPDVGVIVNVGPGAPRAARHGRARGRRQGGADPRPARRAPPAWCPPASRCSTPHLRDDLDTWTFGPGGEVRARCRSRTGGPRSTPRGDADARSSCRYSEPHNLLNTLAAVAAATALGGAPGGPRGACASPRCAARSWSSPGGVTVVNDCYNANPMSMRAALEHLAAHARPSAASRCSATMAELGPDSERYHREIGEPRGRARRSTCWSPWARRRWATPTPSTARCTPWRRPRRPARCSRSWPRPATACSQGLPLGRASSGSSD